MREKVCVKERLCVKERERDRVREGERERERGRGGDAILSFIYILCKINEATPHT